MNPLEAFADARTCGTLVAGTVSGIDGVTELVGVADGNAGDGSATGVGDGDGRATGVGDGDGRAAWLGVGAVGAAAVLVGAGTAVFFTGTGAVVLGGAGVVGAGFGAGAGVGAGADGGVAGGVGAAWNCSKPTVTQMPVPSLLGTTPTPMEVHLGSTMFS
jgi:hypothetical protein